LSAVSDIPQALKAEPPGPAEQLDYDAFLSYTHVDRPVVSGIQKALHRIGRRWGQLRALRVFRDDTDLTVSPDLWGKITDALDRARYLIVVLSPQAAQSVWVNNEVGYWLQNRFDTNDRAVRAHPLRQ
jgi:TIR domain